MISKPNDEPEFINDETETVEDDIVIQDEEKDTENATFSRERRHAIVDIVNPYSLPPKEWIGKGHHNSESVDESTENTNNDCAPGDVSVGDLTHSIDVEDEGIKKVLVVDDDRVARQVLTKLLQQLGFEGMFNITN